MQADKLKALKELVGDEAAEAALKVADQSEQKALAEKRAQKAKAGAEGSAEEEKTEPAAEAATEGDAPTPEEAQTDLINKIAAAHMAAHVAQHHATPAAAAKELTEFQTAVKALASANAAQAKQLADIQKAQKEAADKLKALTDDLPRAVARAYDPTQGDNQTLTDEQIEAMRQKGLLPHEDDPNVKNFTGFLDFAISGKAPK